MKRTKIAGIACAVATLCFIPSYIAFGDNSTDLSNPDPAFKGHAQFPGMNPNSNPDNPSTYPFLPPGKPIPTPGPRSHSPKAIGTDLALNLPYTISAQIPDSYWHNLEQTSYPDRGQLTDGKLASLNFTDPQWVGLAYQYVRDITINLGKVENIHAISLDFLQNLGAGIIFPDDVEYYVSQDGVNWTPVGTVQSAYGAGDFTPQTQSFELTGINVNAQYVRAQFTNKIWAFIDQFDVYGYPNPNPAAKTPEGQPMPNTASGFLTAGSEQTGGVKNMLLVYTDGYGSLGTWTQSDFAPMVADETADGKPKSWLFDTMLFSPYSVETSSGAWDEWLQNLFSPGIQLSALNQAVGELKTQLNDPNFREKVVITIPTISNVSNFGSIDGNASLDLNPSDVGQQVALENKLRAVKWYIDQVISYWNQSDFNNLTLAGFYWQPESLNVTDPNDSSLIEGTSDIIHQEGLKFYWIPFYGAVGITNWRALGFDAVMVQPNVSFNWSMNAEDRFQSVSSFANYYGTGLEIEAHWDVTSSNTSLAQIAQEKYFDYFSAANVFGFENALKSYYENSKTLVTAFQSTNPFYHQVYDNTAAFINGQWASTTIQ